MSKIPGEQALYWGPEVEWLTSVIQSLPLEVTLCHNDVNMLNVLIPNSGAGEGFNRHLCMGTPPPITA